ncbi:MAG: LacI family transcriptional regulator [candidate division KSB1 bacterium]|nr:LacI family transcriptional regulator [candidate division KSB1 bacterium]
MAQIAQRAGVSIATVSRALSGSGRVREETRRRILAIAEELNYRPNSLARGLSRRRTDTIGVILPELVDEFFMDLVQGIEEEAYRANRYILLSSSHRQRDLVRTSLEFMMSGRVDGVILMASQKIGDLEELVTRSRCPIVLLNAGSNLARCGIVNIDNYQGAFAVAEHLIQHGYRKIAVLLGPEDNYDSIERFRGFRSALEKHGIPLPEPFVVPGDFTRTSGFYGFNRLMSQPEKPEAIFAENDMMALGAYDAAGRLGLRIPEDVAIVGFDDIRLSRYIRPPLTTVHVPIEELGRRAVRYLIQVIEGEADHRQPYRQELTTGLIIRESCGCSPTVSYGLV